MDARQLFNCGMTPFDLRNGKKELGIVAKRASDCAKPAYMFGMTPTRVMPAAIRMRNECGLHPLVG